MTKMESDGVQFEAMDRVEPVSVIPQTLDNQWVPRQMLAKMILKSQALADVDRERKEQIRAEYVRALVNARQVILNRAYLYNNQAVFADFVKPGDDRAAFEELLRSGVVVVFLSTERGPYPSEEPGFTTDPRGLRAWREVAKSVPVRCLRLSWDDAENRMKTREQLRRRFHDAAQTAVSSDTSVLVRDLRLPAESEPAFRARLGDLARHCVAVAEEGLLVTREELYEKFVVAEGSKPAEGKYDGSKPFAGEIKQLLDLSYNVNLPDSVDGYALTPIDSLPRTALQEWQKEVSNKEKEITATELLELLRRTAFDLVQGGLYLRSFGSLRMRDVHEIRLTDEWAHYMQGLDGLLRDPLSFADPDAGAAGVYRNYESLAKVVTRIGGADRSTKLAARWAPAVELVIEIAGATLSVVWGAGVAFKIAGAITSKLVGKTAPLIARLVLRGLAERGSKAELSMSYDFMRKQLVDASRQWEMLVAKLRKTPGWVEERGELEHLASTMNAPPEEAYV